jgi:CelD/BcsL family acetyltransferase involved in cellulose biosynthesis
LHRLKVATRTLKPTLIEQSTMEPATHEALDRAYWLSNCEGFRVDSPQGRFGLVEAVMFRSRPNEPDALIVRSGLLARRLVLVPLEDVAEVLPRRQRIVLERVPEASGSDFVTEVCSRLRRLAAADRRASAAGTPASTA